MSDADPKIAYCHACGSAMDVAQVGPYTNVVCPQCGKHTRVKREFGPYTLLRRYALGGMSVVFLARDNELDREVALKILNETFSADEKRIAAFEQEARLTASISHPHVVRLFTTGRAFGHFYIAMEFVPGGHYERKIRDGALPEKDTLGIAMQVAEGLRSAHAAGLIHRDIKPGNILFDESGNAKIVDFGLALVLHGGSAKAEELWATPYYVPPEAIEGRDEDFRSDIYAFGATFYHALAGKPPCSEETMSTPKLREAKQKVVPLSLAAPWLGAETCSLIDKAMAYEPGDRFQSYEELIDALELAMRRAKAGAGRSETANPKSRRRTRSAMGEKSGLLLSVLVFFAVVVVGGWWLTREGADKNAGGDTHPAKTGAKTNSGRRPTTSGDEIRIGTIYQSARKALGARRFLSAEKQFSGLLNDPHTPEPTATSSGIESAIAALLDGRSGGARVRVSRVVFHMAKPGVDSDAEARLLGAAARKFGRLDPVPPDGKKLETPGEILRAMLFGLKDWEQGSMKDAVGWFRKVAALPGDNEWAAVYQKFANDYLADFKVVEANDFDAPPGQPEACRKLVAQIEGARKKLRTKGRAEFDLKNRVVFLTRHLHALEKKQKAAAGKRKAAHQPFAKFMPEVRKRIDASRFAEARKLLANFHPADSAEVIQCGAWRYLVGASADFLDEISNDLRNGSTKIELKTRDGKTYTRVAGVDRKRGLLLASGSDDPVPVAWGDIDAQSVIELHKLLVKRESDPAAQIRRHEHAIAYDFLVGAPQHAKAAADRLSLKNPEFERRWSEAMHALDM